MILKIAGILAALAAAYLQAPAWGASQAAAGDAQIAVIEAMAERIDLAAGEGRLTAQGMEAKDPGSLLREQRIWRDARSLARKFRTELFSGEDSLFADYYYDDSAALRLVVHSSASEISFENQVEGLAPGLRLQQRIYLGKDRKIFRVLAQRLLLGEAGDESRLMEGPLDKPDESVWPVSLVWDPEAEFKKGGASLSPPKAGAAIQGGEISPAQLLDWRARKMGLQLIDVRTPVEYKEGHIAGARLIPLDELSKRSGELDKSLPLALYCRSGQRSAAALKLLRAKGFAQAVHLGGGLGAWQAVGLEIVR